MINEQVTNEGKKANDRPLPGPSLIGDPADGNDV